MNVDVLVACSVLAISALFARRHYLAGLFVALVGLYELTAPFLWTHSLFEEVIPAVSLYSSVANESRVSDHLLAISEFLGSLISAYAFAWWLLRAMGWTRNEGAVLAARVVTASKFYFLLAVILVFGVISFLQDAGQVRLYDYLGYDYYGSPFFSYGTLLIVCLSPIVLLCVQSKSWALLSIALICAAPLGWEVFVSSRRQFFAPALLYGIFYFLYGDRSPMRNVRLTVFVALGLVFLGLQANMRTSITGVSLTNEDEALPLVVQLGEFVAIGSTTLFSVSLVNESYFTKFAHFLIMGIANSIPYYKFGDLAFPEYVSAVQSIIERIAPFGGLSFIAEAYLALGNLGVIIVGAICGAFLAVAENILRHSMVRPLRLTTGSMYVTCLIATLFLKYRSGFTDAFLTIVAFSCLYAFAMLPSFLSTVRLRGALGYRSQSRALGAGTSYRGTGRE
jgi:hypothetical protein